MKILQNDCFVYSGVVRNLKVMLRILFYFCIVFISLSLSAKEKAGSIFLFTDFDETLIRSIDSPWKSYFILNKIEELHSIIQHTDNYEKMPLKFPISTDELSKMEYFLGKGPRRINRTDLFKLNQDLVYTDRPSYIIPGYYELNDAVSFKRYRHNPKVNYLLEDYLHTKTRQNKDRRSFYGLSYDTFSWLMKNPSGGEIIVNTLRGQKVEDFRQLFEAFVEHKDLEKMYSKSEFNSKFRLYSANSLGSRMHGRYLHEKKKNALTNELQDIVHRNLEEGEGFLHTNMDKALRGKREKKHLIIIAEDDPDLVSELFKKTQELSQQPLYRNKIKFVFFNAGRIDFVEDDKLFNGHRIFVFHNGYYRPIIEQELNELHISRKSARLFRIKYIKSPKRIKSSNNKSQSKKSKSNCRKTFKGGSS